MKFFIGLLLFVVACILSLITSLIGVGQVGGRDIGFAGAGLYLFMIPAALVGTLLAYPVSRSISDEVGPRRISFLLSAAFCSWFLGALSMWIFEGGWRVHYMPLPASKGPFVYIPGKNFYVVAQPVAPETVTAGEPVAINLQWSTGEWSRVRQADVPQGVTYYSEQPAPNDTRIASTPIFESQPSGCVTVQSFDAKTGKGVAVYSPTADHCQIISSIKVAATGALVKQLSLTSYIQVNTEWPPMPSPTPLKSQLHCDHSDSIVRCRTETVIPANQ
jgi:hypothetical protein